MRDTGYALSNPQGLEKLICTDSRLQDCLVHAPFSYELANPLIVCSAPI